MSVKRRIAAIEKVTNKKRRGKIFILDESDLDYEDQLKKVEEEIKRGHYIRPLIVTLDDGF